MCDSAEDIPPEWKVAFIALHIGFLGSVRSTNKTSITHKPMEVRAVSGFVRKRRKRPSLQSRSQLIMIRLRSVVVRVW